MRRSSAARRSPPSLPPRKAAAPDPKALAALEPFAESGVPSADALARELTALMPALAKAVGTAPRDGGILDRLKANAERLVRIRPIDEAAGDDPVAILRAHRDAGRAGQHRRRARRARQAAGRRARPAKDWIARAEARNAAVEASRRFAADALAALGKPSP